MPGLEAFIAKQDIIGMIIGFFLFIVFNLLFAHLFQFQVKGIANHSPYSNYYPQDYYFIQAGRKDALY